MHSADVSVVVPVYGNHRAALDCIELVLTSRAVRHCRLVVVDDASITPETPAAIAARLEGEPDCRLICHETNRGFAAAVNSGIEATSGDIVILNSDVLVPQHWLVQLQACAGSDTTISTITPFTNNGSICSYPVFCASSELPDGVSLEEMAALFAQANAGKYLEIPTGVGFCMYITRRSIDAVGIFDVETFGAGYGEENDFCMRASQAGFRHLLCGDLFVYHEGGASFGSSREGLMARADELIEQRHPGYGELVEEFIDRDSPAPLRESVDQLRRQRPDQLQPLLEEANRRTALTLEQRRSLRRVYAREHRELTGYQAKCAELEQLLETARESFAKADDELTRSKNAYASLEKSYAELSAQLDEARADSQRIEAAFRQLEARIRELLPERDRLAQDCERQSFELAQAKEQRDENRAHLENTTQLLEQARAEFAASDTRLRETLAELESMRTTLETRTNELEALNQLLVVRVRNRLAGVLGRD